MCPFVHVALLDLDGACNLGAPRWWETLSRARRPTFVPWGWWRTGAGKLVPSGLVNIQIARPCAKDVCFKDVWFVIGLWFIKAVSVAIPQVAGGFNKGLLLHPPRDFTQLAKILHVRWRVPAFFTSGWCEMRSLTLNTMELVCSYGYIHALG